MCAEFLFFSVLYSSRFFDSSFVCSWNRRVVLELGNSELVVHVTRELSPVVLEDEATFEAVRL